MSSKPINLAVIGATGLIGRTMLKVLEERFLPVADLFPVASEKSRGQQLTFQGRSYEVTTLEEGAWRQAEFALLSPGAVVSREWISKLVEAGLVCIDNSSAFRQDESVPLVVPEVNPQALTAETKIIANPNCSTIQLVVALWPLHRAFGLEEVVVATYQSVSGAGQRGKTQLQEEMDGQKPSSPPFPHPIFHNVIPAIGSFRDDGYGMEEWKMIAETRKIMSLPELRVFPTTVRVPVAYGHSEAVHLTFTEKVTPGQVRKVLQTAPGLSVQDNPADQVYPMPIYCAGRDEVFVGRIRQCRGETHTLDLWIVADNRRKGAATNAVQILEILLER